MANLNCCLHVAVTRQGLNITWLNLEEIMLNENLQVKDQHTYKGNQQVKLLWGQKNNWKWILLVSLNLRMPTCLEYFFFWFLECFYMLLLLVLCNLPCNFDLSLPFLSLLKLFVIYTEYWAEWVSVKKKCCLTMWNVVDLESKVTIR